MKSSEFLQYYRIFRGYAGARLHLLLLVVALGGFLESVGIGLFIPLLNIGKVASGEADALSAGLAWALSLAGVAYTLNALLVVMLCVFVAKGLATLAEATLSGHITATLTHDLRHRLVTLLSRTSYGNFSDLHTGLLTNVVTTESDRAVASFGHYANTVVSAVYVLAYGALALMIDLRGALIFCAFGLVIVRSVSMLHGLSRKYSRLTTERNASLHDLLIQTIHSFKYLRATDRFGALIAKVSGDIRDLSRYVFRLSVVTATLRSLTEPVGAAVLVLLLFVSVSVLGEPLAEVLFLALVVYRLTSKLLAFQQNWQKFNATAGGLEAYQKIFERLESDMEGVGGEVLTGFSGSIDFRDVSFSYHDHLVLDSVSIHIPKHSMVGIVGKTGSGKSTIVNLLTGVLEPDEGEILIDGQSLTSVDKSSLRRLIGYVTQENVIFRDTVANNVSLWDPAEESARRLERVKAALREVHADTFVEGTEDGYDTMMGDRGLRMSGGQRQQIAIAREIYKNPKIIILDEAMSALDARSEWLIHRQLAEWRGNRTIIVVTHRLASVKECDYVYVLADGRVTEEGTFEELYAEADSGFRELARLQGL